MTDDPRDRNDDDATETREHQAKRPDADGNGDDVPEIEIDAGPEALKPNLVLASDVLPGRLPVLTLRPRPFFPGMPAPLEVRGEDRLSVVRHAIEHTRETLALVLVRDPEADDTPDNLHDVGVAAKVVKAVQTDSETAHVLVNVVARITLSELSRGEVGLEASIEVHPPVELDVNEELKAYSLAVISTLKELVQLNPLQSEAIRMFLGRKSLDDPGLLADFAANLTTADGQELQRVLEAFDVRRRLDRVLVLLKKEVEIARLQGEIQKQIEEKITGQQREFFLREQLKAIKKELGLEKEGKTTEIETFRERLESRTLPEDAHRVVEEELGKFELLEPASPEYTVTRNYLDWLTVLPWGVHTDDSYDVAEARQVLDRDHYGLEDVKERILEFIAVGKMKGDIAGSIVCLVGPPGVGKTSIGRSVAEAVGREFYRFSLGGMRDEAEIKGHRRTYIGAMPGKFIQAMKTAGSENPVIMLDEIDKVGASFQGDPASALLEVLDPEQNEAFRDHYLDVPFDLSNVLFLATANQLDTIPRPLLDRMEIIRLSGYILEEKLEIGRRYLVPKALEAHGVPKSKVSIHKAALARVIDDYAREAGVRGLEKQIRKIVRKAVVRLAQKPDHKITVRAADVETWLGKPTFRADDSFGRIPGVVTGLAWTSLGGATLQIEATAVESKSKGFKLTGQLGEVMVESASIAYSYVMAHLETYGADAEYFDRHFVHVHVPAGATPKDGPSAGVTIATALISMIRGKPARAGVAMTGELTLTGHVLAIGGVREKVIAARRAGQKRLIFPEANRGDFDELPDYLKKGLDVHFAERFEAVYEAAFA